MSSEYGLRDTARGTMRILMNIFERRDSCCCELGRCNNADGVMYLAVQCYNLQSSTNFTIKQTQLYTDHVQG
jgi:hypothetical protein